MMPPNALRYVTLFAVMAAVSDALDLSFEKIVCDETLPAYALEDDVHMLCNGDNRCTFGDQTTISGNRKFVRFELLAIACATSLTS
jgi:hypothetical protein